MVFLYLRCCEVRGGELEWRRGENMVSLWDLLTLVSPSVYLIQPKASSTWREENGRPAINKKNYGLTSIKDRLHVALYFITYGLFKDVVTSTDCTGMLDDWRAGSVKESGETRLSCTMSVSAGKNWGKTRYSHSTQCTSRLRTEPRIFNIIIIWATPLTHWPIIPRIGTHTSTFNLIKVATVANK